MPDNSTRPDAGYIQERRTHLENLWGDTHAVWRDTDLFYQRQYSIWAGANSANYARTRGQYRPSTSTNIIDHASDQFMGFIPTLRREPVNPQIQAHKDAADAVEIAVKSLMMDAAMKAMFNPWKQLSKHLNAYGYGIIEFGLDFTDMTEGRRHPAYWNPVRIDATHPARVLMEPHEKVPSAALKLLNMRAGELAVLLSKKKNRRDFNSDGAEEIADMSPWEYVELEEEWTPDWHTLKRKSGDILYQERNAWKFVPFAQTFAGFGMEPTDMAQSDPQHMAQGILQPVKESIRLEAQNATAKHTMVIDQAYAPFGSRFPDILQQALETGAIAPGEQGDYWKMQLQDVPRWVFESGREIQDDIRRGTYNPGISGFREPGVTTVGQQAILDSAGRRKFSGPSMQEEHIASLVAGWILRIVDNLSQLKTGIGSHGRHLKRSDIYGVYDMIVTFEVLDPVIQMQRRELGLREYEIGLKSDEDYWEEDARAENVALRRQRLRQQRIRQHPAIDSRLIAAEAAAMDEVDAEDVEALRAAAQEGQLPLTQPPMGAQEVARPLREPLSENVARPARIDNVGALLGE